MQAHMETKVHLAKSPEPLNVLLIGNNPIDLTKTLEKLNQIHGRKIITEIAFDLRSIVERLINFNPNYILIDDNIGRSELTQTIHALSKTRKTRDVPITVLKNSNYHESSASGILDYVLKQHFSAESFYSILRNSLKFKRTQLFLFKAYQKRKKQLRKLHF
jgi:CheY-like chemotaxis protein